MAFGVVMDSPGLAAPADGRSPALPTESAKPRRPLASERFYLQ
jgi:hypothetical protein